MATLPSPPPSSSPPSVPFREGRQEGTRGRMSAGVRRRSVALGGRSGALSSGGDQEPRRPQSLDWRAAAWHPHRPLLAVARGADDALAFFDAGVAGSGGSSEGWAPLLLRADLALNPGDLAWCPTADALAVACARGVALWSFVGGARVSPASAGEGEGESAPSARGAPPPPHASGNTAGIGGGAILEGGMSVGDSSGSGNAWVGLLQQPSKTRVVSVSWSPQGRLLASAAEADPHVLVWDTVLRRHHPLHTDALGCPCLVSWSPAQGKHLFAAFDRGGFGVWETQRWGLASWEFPGRCRAVAWSPDGRRLAVLMGGASPGDLLWVRLGDRWVRGTLDDVVGAGPGSAAGGGADAEGLVAVRLEEDPTGPLHHCGMGEVIIDKPLFVGEVQEAGEEADGDFSIAFESCFTPPPSLEGRGLPPLAGGLISSLVWTPDGAGMVATFTLPIPQAPQAATLLSAVCLYSVSARHESLNLALLHVLDLRTTPSPPPALKLLPRVVKREILAASVWGDVSHHVWSGRDEAPHLALYSFSACPPVTAKGN